MSITSEIQRINTNIANAYTELENKGATIPTDKNSNNLSSTISTITGGGGGGTTVEKGFVIDEYDANGFPTKVSLVGFTSIPDRYLQQAFTTSYLSLFKNITSLVVPEGVTSIGFLGLATNNNLFSITLPESLTTLGNNALATNGLTSLTIPNSVTSVGTSCFSYNRQLKTLDIPSGIKNIPDNLCQNCSGLNTVIVRGDIGSIGSSAFTGCPNMMKLVLPNVTKVPSLASSTSLPVTSVNGGEVYVPDELRDSFRSATNWSSIKGAIMPLSSWSGEL